MRNWIIEDLYRMILLYALSGTSAYLVWRLLAFGMTERKKLKYVYPMLTAVMAFFFVPVLELWFVHLYIRKDNIVWMIGYFYQRTPFIYKLRSVLMTVWFTGTAVSFGSWMYRMLAMRRLVVKHTFPAEKELVKRKDKLAAALRLRQRVNICRSYAISSPMVTGLWRKTVVLPVEEYEEEQLEVILCHELVHIRQHIVDLKHIGAIIQIFQWFNP